MTMVAKGQTSPRRRLLLCLFSLLLVGTAKSFVLAPTHSSSAAVAKKTFQRKQPSASTSSSSSKQLLAPLQMDFQNPVESFLNDKLLKFAGPITTLGLTLPQLQDNLSMKNIQRVGETSFAAMVAIAAIQGALIMHQYGTNPAGELIVPPGLTFGKEDATKDDTTIVASVEKRELSTLSLSSSTSSDNKRRQQVKESLHTIEELICTKSDESLKVNVKKGWYHVNRLLILLVPLAIEQFGFLALQYSHLMHLAVIMGLVHTYDFFQQLPDTKNCVKISDEPEFDSEQPHIVVLGDSMSVGIGCVNKFDPEKNSGILRRIEEVEPSDAENNNAFGPVFPRILARTLSQRLGKPVTWRSAGVDGGETNHIRHYLLPVIQEEVDNGRPPDVVVVLTGSNDLKHILQTDKETGGRASVRGFRANLMQLVHEIHEISPNTRVVLPALPTYRLDTNSILNIFPLSLFLDGLIGFWDAQKKHVADRCPGVMHVDLKFQDVFGWYEEDLSPDIENTCDKQAPTLLAADGIHPNAECYRKWGKFVANAICDRVAESQQYKRKTTQPRHALTPNNIGWASSH